jgi:O-antigen ligase
MSRFKPADGLKTAPERLPLRTRDLPLRRTSVVAPPTPVDADTPLPQEEPESARAAGNLALGIALAFIFLRFSFLHELLMAKIGFDSHLLLILGAGSFLATLLSGGLFAPMSNKICLAWFSFTACMILATAASTWRGGSFAVLYPYLRTTLILVVLIPAVATTPKALSQVMKTIGLAGLAIVVLGFSVDDYRSGRLELSGAGASIQNSNDYAALLILVMPAIAYFAMREGKSIVFKIIGLVALAAGCFLVLSTGSRGALISIAISMLFVLKAGSAKVRLGILVGGPVIALIVIPFLPGEASVRLASLFDSNDQSTEAAQSQMQRTALLIDSLKFTAQHPLLGVGPGTFQDYQAHMAEDNGQRGMWHETHNSYTQVSSECGIPALVFYLAAIAMSFAVFRRGRKSSNPDLRALSSILGLMVVSFSVTMFFLSQAYGFGFPVLGGLAISLDRILDREAAAIT